MQKILLTVILVLLFVSTAADGALAGKPRPTPTPPPYPSPAMEAQAYPAPGQGLPGPMLPAADPRPGVPFAWGYFGKWFVTVQPSEQLTLEYGIICLNWIGHGQNYCTEIGYESYNAAERRLVYSANPSGIMCGKWWGIIYVYFLGQWADIRTPNEYWIGCGALPFAPKTMIEFPAFVQ